jgi:23S rRNA (uracil1939-C5)-methyltransferase
MKKSKYPLLERITIQGIASEGKCIARYEEKVIFIDGFRVAPQDVVDLQIIGKRKNYMEAVPVHFHQYSPLRIQPFCTHFGVCGGCKWQHIDYSTQLEYKQQQVIDNLTRIGKLDIPSIRPIIGSAQTQYYRNKLEFTFSNKKWHTQAKSENQIEQAKPEDDYALGFHVPGRFDKVLPILHCYLQPEPSNSIRLSIENFALKNNLTFYDLKNHEGLLRNLVIRTSNTGDLMVLVVFGQSDLNTIDLVMSHLQTNFPQITSLQYFINTKFNDSYADLEPVLFAGKPYIEEQMPSLSGKLLKYRIGAKSFYQTNSAQAYRLYRVAGEMADLQGDEIVYDLYTGTGTIANFVADKASKVVGLEYVAAAIEDAKVNSEINQVQNTAFLAGDIKDLLNESFLNQYGKPNTIITDPPRAGMHEDVVKMLLKTQAQKIVYVSCNPATQARDLALLSEGYQIVDIQPVDMFPQTHHVENVVKLVKK